jgi:polysaccharide pyruvyl transferase CsaB
MKIVVSGYYGFSNTGDEAILKVLNSYLKDKEITVLSANPQKTKKIYSLNSIYRYDLLKIFKEFKNSQILLSGGGGLIQDKTSLRSLLYYLSIIYFAKFLNLKTIVFSQSIGPLTKKIGKFLTRKILNKVDIITVRDKNSLEILKELKIEKPEIFLTADLGLLLKEAEEKKIEEIFKKENISQNSPLLGIVIRPWKELKIEEIVKFLKIFKKEYKNWEVVLIPFQYGEDYSLLKKIKKEIPEVQIIKNEYLPEEILGIIKKMNFLIGMRLHSLIFASIENVPFIGIIYDKKVEEFLKEVEVEGINLEELNSEKIFMLVKEKLGKIEEIKKNLKIKTEILKKRAEENLKFLI